ncbi:MULTISPECIES: helix-turn-helix domain-containing protein [unclassified Allomuricauda]|uniref:helix-turn-helix domain-containing protein n=1 Tax=unclassified Allomuricauda TaxID=2615049 RepID=UPI00273FC89B|nr:MULTISPECIES: helix-turn-helix domain-containing protein [unclassified Allomuricauda]
MNTIDIFLIIICGAGLIHGLSLGVYFGFVKSKRTKSDVFLAILLSLMAFRVGKSIILQFNANLELLFILMGLSVLSVIGPLLYWYTNSLIHVNYKLTKRFYLHLVPFLAVIAISITISKEWLITNGKLLFFLILVGVYLHLAFYILGSSRLLYVFNRSIYSKGKTKSQEKISKWLKWVILGTALIWFSYVLNIFDDKVPYILGPIIYSVCIYVLTYIGFALKISDIDSKKFEQIEDNLKVYKQVEKLITDCELYLASNVSLQKLSDLTGYSNHTISLSINQYAKMNFNNYINQYRIQKAKSILDDDTAKKYTIASIAYDSGFSSLSSFNAAFKKFEKTTPSAYRKSI